MKKIIAIFALLVIFFACSKSEDQLAPENNYDRTALLTHWADNIIVPSFINYQSKVQAVVTDNGA